MLSVGTALAQHPEEIEGQKSHESHVQAEAELVYTCGRRRTMASSGRTELRHLQNHDCFLATTFP